MSPNPFEVRAGMGGFAVLVVDSFGLGVGGEIVCRRSPDPINLTNSLEN
jgi:hypothetical protein